MAEAPSFEIHTNLPVSDAIGTPGARYVVDVAVAEPGEIPQAKPEKGEASFEALDNLNLITFIEAKSLVVYPMLIAQFIGIVHELLPSFLKEAAPADFDVRNHFYPSLVSLGYLHEVGASETRRPTLGGCGG